MERERERERRRDRKKYLLPAGWFTLHVATTNSHKRAEPKPGAGSFFPVSTMQAGGCRVPRVSAVLDRFSRPQAGRELGGSGASGT